MPRRASHLGKTLFVLILLAAPLAAHLALVTQRGAMVASSLVAVQSVMVCWIALAAVRRTLQLLACGFVFLLVVLLSRQIDGGPLVAAAVPHAMAYLALLALFLASLRPGHEPVVTILARRSRGFLPPEIMRYTRRVTWLWCGFFLAQVVASLLLMWFAPWTVWSWFINLCNLPLVFVMICGEYAYRQWRHAARPPERLVDMLRIFRQVQAVPVNEEN
jgi:uncharacterized membrane protein